MPCPEVVFGGREGHGKSLGPSECPLDAAAVEEEAGWVNLWRSKVDMDHREEGCCRQAWQGMLAFLFIQRVSMVKHDK